MTTHLSSFPNRDDRDREVVPHGDHDYNAPGHIRFQTQGAQMYWRNVRVRPEWETGQTQRGLLTLVAASDHGTSICIGSSSLPAQRWLERARLQ